MFGPQVKFRRGDQIKAMHRLDATLKVLDQDPEGNKEAIKAREDQLLPVYLQVAHEFADLHDRAGRMEAKGVIRKALEWKNSRKYFHSRLMRRLQEGARLLAELGFEGQFAIRQSRAYGMYCLGCISLHMFTVIVCVIHVSVYPILLM